MMKRAAILLGCLALAALASVGATAQVVRSGNLVVTIDGKVSPGALPRVTPAPITLSVSGSLKTADGSHPPALKELFLQFDRHGRLNTTGLAVCSPRRVRSTLTTQAKRACGDALIGQGRVEAEIALPEQPAFSASGPLLIFNGPEKQGHRTLVFHVYAHVPAPTAFVTTAEIGEGSGRYGPTARVKIPTIVAGQGSLTGFRARVHRTFVHKKRRESALLASCPTGRLYARGDFTFANGESLSGLVTRSCTPKGR